MDSIFLEYNQIHICRLVSGLYFAFSGQVIETLEVHNLMGAQDVVMTDDCAHHLEMRQFPGADVGIKIAHLRKIP